MSEDRSNITGLTDNKREIVIQLSLKDSESMNPNFIIQIDAMERMQHIINEFAQKDKTIKKNPKDFFEKKRANNSILLHGQRGYGKTTFAKSIVNKYYAEESTVYPLVFIDPTLIKSNENLLVHIIEALVTNVKKSLNSCCGNQEQKTSFKSALSEVSEGLKSISQSYSEQTWILNDALNQAHSDRNLENSINKLFQISAQILKKELFLVILDDVDTNTEKAYDVLEIIRCYMSSPYVCTIAIGDISLYRYIILRKKSEELSPRSMDKFNKIQDKFELLSRNLEEQYFFKIFDASRQVSISRLDQIISDKKNNVFFQIFQDKEKIEARKLISDIFKKTSNLPIEKIESYLEFFLSLPLRTIFQLFYNIFKEDASEGGNKSYQINNLNFVENLEKSFELGDFFDIQGDFYRFAESCLEFYISEGKSKDCVCGYLIDNDINYNIRNLYISSKLKYSKTQNKNINEFENFTCYMICVCAGFYFQSLQTKENTDPNLFSLKKNTCLMDFATSTSLNISNLGNSDQRNFGIFRILKKPKSTDKNNFDEWVNIFSDIFLDQTPEKIKEIQKINPNYNFLKSVNDLTFNDFTDFLNKIDETLPSESTKFFIALHAFRSSCFQKKSSQGDLDYFSMLNLISFLSKISTCKNMVSENLVDLISNFDFGWSDFFYNSESSIKEKRYEKASHYLKNWVTKEVDLGFSQILAGKIWRRFFEASSNVLIHEKDCAGIVLQRLIFSFINASLIEEFNWGRLSEVFDREKIGYMSHAKNPNKSLNALRSNFSNVLSLHNKKKDGVFSISDNFPFTTILLRSPIISQFIAYGISGNINDKSGMRGVISAFLNDQSCYESLYGEEATQSSRLLLMYISLLVVQGSNATS